MVAEKVVIIVRKGMVDAVFSNKDVIREVEIIDMDTTDVKEERRTKLRAKRREKFIIKFIKGGCT